MICTSDTTNIFDWVTGNLWLFRIVNRRFGLFDMYFLIAFFYVFFSRPGCLCSSRSNPLFEASLVRGFRLQLVCFPLFFLLTFAWFLDSWIYFCISHSVEIFDSLTNLCISHCIEILNSLTNFWISHYVEIFNSLCLELAGLFEFAFVRTYETLRISCNYWRAIRLWQTHYSSTLIAWQSFDLTTWLTLEGGDKMTVCFSMFCNFDLRTGLYRYILVNRFAFEDSISLQRVHVNFWRSRHPRYFRICGIRKADFVWFRCFLFASQVQFILLIWIFYRCFLIKVKQWLLLCKFCHSAHQISLRILSLNLDLCGWY